MRVSVALCTLNGEQYLSEQLKSLEEQERPPDEVVVCDDGSTDGTVPLLEAFAARTPFPVTIHVNPRTIGTTANFDRAIGLCDGDAVALCDQDDVWLPGRLRRAAETFEAGPEVGFTFGDAELVDPDGRPSGRRLWASLGLTRELRRQVEVDGLLPVLLTRKLVTGATMTFRTELRDVVLPIPDIWRHDAWIALLCAFVSTWAMLSEPLVRYRIHPGQQVGLPAFREDGGARIGPPGSDDHGSEGHRQRLGVVAEQYELVAERMRAVGTRGEGGSPLDDPVKELALRRVEELARHHRARAGFPQRRIYRVPAVLREWRTGRYRELSRGLASAVKDLVR